MLWCRVDVLNNDRCYGIEDILNNDRCYGIVDMANSIVTGVTFAHFFEFCVYTTVDNNNETI